jgi:hypothetical protein
MQADSYAGYYELYEGRRQPAPIIEAACWAHGRRKFFDLAKLAKAPIACGAVRRIDELFEIEREINGCAPEQHLASRREKSKPLVDVFEAWLHEQRDRVSAKSEIAKPSTTASIAGLPSPGSSTTDVSASQTMPPSAPCAASRSADRTGLSQVLIPEATGQLPSTR